MRNVWVWTLAVVVACTTTPMLISQPQEKKMGEEAFAQILKEKPLSKNKKQTEILERVGTRIAAQVSDVDFQWEFKLIESGEMNAFCLPGGKVAFYTGILPVLENEAAMAMVMGHEVAHAVLRHGAQRMSQGMLAQLGLSAIDATILQDKEYRGAAMAALGLGTQVGVMLPFSRHHESEADEVGLKYAAAAGYDPAEAVRFWQRFSIATGKGGKPPEWLSTHPADDTRIKKLSSELENANMLYDKSPKYGLGVKL